MARRTGRDITTKPDTASAPADSVKSSTDHASVKIASVGGLLRAKVKAVGAWSAGRSGQSRGSSRSARK